MSISPADGFTTTSADLKVTVDVTDDFHLQSYQVTLTGATGPTFFFQLANNGATGTSSNIIHLQSGSGNVVSVHVCDNESACTDQSATFTYSPPPPPPAQGAPIIALTPHHNDLRDAASCPDCGSGMSYTTPSYVSLDAPRSVSLAYASEMAAPTGFIALDVDANSTTAPSQMSLKLKRPDGSFVPLKLANGSTTTELFYSAGSGVTRLAAQFDASGLTTGAYTYTAVVRNWWGAQMMESTAPVRVLVRNEAASPYGDGWTVAAVSHLLPQSDSGMVVSAGTGMEYFGPPTCSGDCTFVSPAGDFNTLVQLATTKADGTKYEYRLLDGTVESFLANGNLLNVKDRYGNTTSFTYVTGTSQVATITDPAGKVITLSYGVNGSYGATGKLNTITDPGNRQVHFIYNANGELTTIVDPDGANGLVATYDAQHRVVTQTYRTGAQTDIAYDAYGAVDSVKAPQVQTTDAGLFRPVTTIRSLAAALLPLAGTGGSSASPGRRVVPDSATLVVTGPKGAVNRVRVNRFGAATYTEVVELQGQKQITQATYDTLGRSKSTVDAKNAVTTYSWDGPDLQQVTGGGTTVEYGYEPTYHQVDTLRVNGALQQANFYGVNGRLDSTKVDTMVSTYTYDSRGRVTSVHDPFGHQTTTAYTSTGFQNTQSVTAPTGTGANGTTTFAYDGFGRDTSTTDPLSHTVRTSYDLLNRRITITQPGSITTTFGYDDVHRRYTTTDPKNHAYTDSLNALGWVVRKTDPRGGYEQFQYDRDGNMTIYTNRRGQQVVTAYDSLDRPIRLVADGDTTTYGYDPDLNWTSVSNGESTDTVFSDASNRVVKVVTVRDSTYTLTYTYTGSFRSGLTATGPWGSRSMTFGQDDLHRFNFLHAFTTRGTSVFYNGESLPSSIPLPTGASLSERLIESVGYNSAHLPATVSYGQALNAVLGRRYAYDKLERITTATKGTPAGSGDQDETQRTLTYNTLGQLTSYTDKHNWQEEGDLVCPDPFDVFSCYHETINHSDLIRSGSYTYDNVGNRTDHSATYESTSNRLLSFNGYTLSYDADGNLTGKQKAGFSQTFTWNSLGQLTSATTNGVTTTFAYDGLGRRVRKVTGSTTTRYLWDGGELLMELDAAGNRIREYAYYPSADAPHSVRVASTGKVYHYIMEAPGQVVALVDSANHAVDKYEYDPYGVLLDSTEAVPQPLKYMGRELDSETGLYYVRARYYDPSLGRFISEDPGGVSGGINPYAYLAGEPINSRDPSGMHSRWRDSDCMFVGENEYIIIDISGPITVVTSYCANGPGGVNVVGQSFGGSYEPPPTPDPLAPFRQPPTEACGLACAAAGGGGGGGGIKDKVCRLIPDGRVEGGNLAVGGIGAQTGTVEVVKNYNTGTVTTTAGYGITFGFNGGVSASGYSGFAYGLTGDNGNYQGGSTSLSFTPIPVLGGFGNVGVFGACSSGGLMNNPTDLHCGDVHVIGITGNVALGPTLPVAVAATNYSQPKPIGRFALFSLKDYALYLARQLCNR
ncbi:MAG TPA: RHS repeat-associated core domain-containing protein [Gemmatimonadaceae bacterium]|nr:RHS repeat-associated core domain-containing protein [Gemmatimonadaceae bacterium]